MYGRKNRLSEVYCLYAHRGRCVTWSVFLLLLFVINIVLRCMRCGASYDRIYTGETTATPPRGLPLPTRRAADRRRRLGRRLEERPQRAVNYVRSECTPICKKNETSPARAISLVDGAALLYERPTRHARVVSPRSRATVCLKLCFASFRLRRERSTKLCFVFFCPFESFFTFTLCVVVAVASKPQTAFITGSP